MSDEEIENIDGVEEDDDEQDIADTVIIQELIALVQANPALYAKKSKEYAGKNFCKDLAWENIGSNLSRQISGKDAAKMWYNIRQRFGRERRKVIATLKGKSGQGSQPVYVPKWQFYNLCLFLVDHITPRKTTSNYTKKKTTIIGKTYPFILPSLPLSSSLLPSSTSSSQALTSQALSVQVPSSQALSPQSVSLQILSLQIPSSQASSPLSSQTLSPVTPSSQAESPQAPSSPVSVLLSPSSIWSGSDLETVVSATDDSVCVFSVEDNEESRNLLHVSTSLSNNLNVKDCSAASVTASPTSKEVLKTIKRISTSTTKTVPELDKFAKCRKKDDNLLVQTISKQSTALTSIASKLEKSLAKDSGETPSALCMDPVLNAIGYVLKSVPEDKRLECMVELLQVIKSKFAQ